MKILLSRFSLRSLTLAVLFLSSFVALVFDYPAWKVRRIEFDSDKKRIAGFSPDGKFLVTGQHQGELHIWDARNWTVAKKLVRSGISFLNASWSPDRKQIATALSDGKGTVWNAETGECIMSLEAPKKKDLSTASEDQNQSLTWLSYSEDGKFLMSFPSIQTQELFDSQSGQWLRSQSNDDYKKVNYVLPFSTPVDRNMDEKIRIRFAWDTGFQICYLESRQEYTVFKPGYGEMYQFALSPNGQAITICKDKSTDPIILLFKNRPEAWWGVAWLTSFWAVVLFLVVLVWSRYRDVKETQSATTGR